MRDINVAPYRKLIAALIGGLIIVLTAVGEVIADGSVDFAEVLLVFAAVGTAVGVYEAKNASPSE